MPGTGRSGLVSGRARHDAVLCGEIRWRDENRQVYGERKVWKQMGREGRRLARCTIPGGLVQSRTTAGTDREYPASVGRSGPLSATGRAVDGGVTRARRSQGFLVRFNAIEDLFSRTLMANEVRAGIVGVGGSPAGLRLSARRDRRSSAGVALRRGSAMKDSSMLARMQHLGVAPSPESSLPALTSNPIDAVTMQDRLE